jgi:Protein of unknown function (DUF1640)
MRVPGRRPVRGDSTSHAISDKIKNMNNPAFDTHKTVKHLAKNGFTEEQAEAVTGVLIDISERYNSSAATKADVETARIALETKIDKLDTKIDKVDAATRAELGVRITSLEHKIDKIGMSLTIKLGAIVFALMSLSTGAVIAAMRYMLIR